MRRKNGRITKSGMYSADPSTDLIVAYFPILPPLLLIFRFPSSEKEYREKDRPL